MSKSIEADVLKRLGNYKCENQMSFKDFGWDFSNEDYENRKSSAHNMHEKEDDVELTL